MFTGSSRVGKTSLKYNLLHNKPRKDKKSTTLLEAPEVAMISRVGKTSLKYNLLHDEPRKDKKSTEAPEVAMISEAYVRGWSGLWTEVKDEFLGEMFSNAEIKSQKKLPTVKLPSNEQPVPGSNSTSEEVVEEDEILSDDSSQEAADSSDNNSDRMLLYDAHKSFLERYHSKSEQDVQLKDVTFIYLLDTGGQPSFQEALPMLLDFPCNFVHTFNASCKLTDPYINTYCRDGKTEEKPEGENTQTSWELMQQSLMSAYTMSLKHKHYLEKFGGNDPKLRIFIVGTHLGKLKDSPDKEEVLISHDNVLEQIESKVYHDFIKFPKVTYQDHKSYVLLDSQFEGEKDEIDHSKKALADLRQRLSDEEACMELAVPKLWYCLLLITRKIEKKMWNYSDLKWFCIEKSYIDKDHADERFKDMLSLFHSLGFYVYFHMPDKMSSESNLVCTDATFLYQEISKVLTVQYADNHPSLRRFRKTGEIPAVKAPDLFDALSVDKSIPPAWLLSVLHHVGIAAKTSKGSKDHYFLPSVLPSRNALDLLPQKGTVDNLSFTISCETECASDHFYGLPTGVFHHLVVDMANRSSTKDAESLHTWARIPDQAYSNIIKFNIANIYSDVYLVRKVDHIELVLLCKSCHSLDVHELNMLCTAIKCEMNKRIEYVLESLFGKDLSQVTLETGVLCTGKSCQSEKSDTEHLLLLTKSITGTCTKNNEQLELQPRQSIWMEKVMIKYLLPEITVSTQYVLFSLYTVKRTFFLLINMICFSLAILILY